MEQIKVTEKGYQCPLCENWHEYMTLAILCRATCAADQAYQTMKIAQKAVIDAMEHGRNLGK